MTTAPSDLHPAIASELYKAMEKLGAPPELLAILGSYSEQGEDPAFILRMLKDYNETGSVFAKVICGQ